MDSESPFNAIPPLVVVLFVAILGIEIVLFLAAQGMVGGPGGVGWRLRVIEDFGFSPAVWDQVMLGNWSADMLRRFVTYPFVHWNFTHAIFAGVMLLALGKFVAELFGQMAVAIVWVVASIIAAAIYGMFAPGNVALFGAYPPVYGLIGAYSYALWLRLGDSGGNRLRAFRLIGFLMALQLVYSLLFGSQPQWIADIAGFLSGFAVSTVVAPGGWTAFRARMRSR